MENYLSKAILNLLVLIAWNCFENDNQNKFKFVDQKP